MDKDNIYLSIVVPAFNEAKRIKKILMDIERYQKKKSFSIQVIVVDDASTDQTVQITRSFKDRISNLRIITNRHNLGKGGAVRRGVLESAGEYVIFADADNSTPIAQVDKLLKVIKKYDIAIGSRYCLGSKIIVPQPLSRRIGSKIIRAIVKYFLALNYFDTQCGFKLFKRSAAKKIFKRKFSASYAFDIELLLIARKLAYCVSEVAINWYDKDGSKVRPVRDGLKTVYSVLSFRFRQLF